MVEHSTPLWRLVGVIAAFSALGAMGYYLNVVGRIPSSAADGPFSDVNVGGDLCKRVLGR